jgi:hypothetical protein
VSFLEAAKHSHCQAEMQSLQACNEFSVC